MQLLAHQFRDEAGESDVTLHALAEWAVERRYLPLPQPKSAIDVLAQEFAKALRQETRVDEKTHRAFRVNHPHDEWRAGKQVTLWGDIDLLGHDAMLKSFQRRRQSMVADAVSLADDVDHWNRVNSGSEPIQIEFDLGSDITWE